MTTPRVLKVLCHVHPSFDPMDLIGPYEIFSWGRHGPDSNPELRTPAFENFITSGEPNIIAHSKLSINIDLTLEEAYEKLAEFDILLIPGGGSQNVLPTRAEPISLIKTFSELPKREDGGVRTLMSVCTGSLFLAESGVLAGKSATTHPLYTEKLKTILEPQGGKVYHEERFVANPIDEEKGLRIVTGGGISAGMDAALFVIGEVLGKEKMEKAAWTVQYNRREGVVL
ncbi:Class I glutamine amidotransferase-like protein [Glarea lozoyensis ATCC 20868]|uniref:Class I glutamine amidotransferase-like protein n=1 Tax=Glarea lozoyensis (strain ATCC 20868 / MF5171) TaxID=1116229 RepID=S3CWT8_GLAL2|nr:Class I glutamine amidotransferase-like protein [Glarea lozoyensis ATCC 20868]EPE29414.1 Class I glutamine amidotransferase-like protein [Glarea lozoyensis ATCC 20868]